MLELITALLLAVTAPALGKKICVTEQVMTQAAPLPFKFRFSGEKLAAFKQMLVDGSNPIPFEADTIAVYGGEGVEEGKTWFGVGLKGGCATGLMSGPRSIFIKIVGESL